MNISSSSLCRYANDECFWEAALLLGAFWFLKPAFQGELLTQKFLMCVVISLTKAVLVMLSQGGMNHYAKVQVLRVKTVWRKSARHMIWRCSVSLQRKTLPPKLTDNYTKATKTRPFLGEECRCTNHYKYILKYIFACLINTLNALLIILCKYRR